MATSAAIPLSDLVIGYPKLAGQIGLLPEIAIFRSFSALNAQNLLYLQAELIHLEQQLRKQERADSINAAQGNKATYAVNWFWLYQSKHDGDEDQLKLVQTIRARLKEYNKALLQYSTILDLPKPSKWDLNDIQSYLETDDMGPLALIGDDATTWGSTAHPKTYNPDLITLRERHNEDAFSKLVTEKVIKLLFRCGCARWKKSSSVYGAVGFKDRIFLRIAFWITTVVASLLPIASITVLYCVHSAAARLGVIAAFNVVVSICVAAFTTAKATDVFAVAAA